MITHTHKRLEPTKKIRTAAILFSSSFSYPSSVLNEPKACLITL